MSRVMIAIYGVALLSPFIVMGLIGSLGAEHHMTLVSQIGLTLGVLGFMILMLQVFMAARIKFLTKPFGLDMVLRYHRNVALAALGCLILHPVLLAAGSGHWDLLYSLKLPWYLLLAKFSLLLLVINLALSWFQRRWGIPFERWRRYHDVLGPAILLGIFVHSFEAGDDLEQAALQGWWFLLLAGAAAMFIWHRLARPALLAKRAYQVEEVRPEAGDVTTLELAPPAGQKPYDHLPGQFHFLTVLDSQGPPREEHHFTISSSPTRTRHRSSTIKALGDFTSRVSKMKPGDRVAVHGPFGRFSYLLYPDERELVFIVGGIGITPVMSMLRHMRDTGSDRSAILFYSNPSLEAAVFREELEEMAAQGRPRLGLVHILQHPPEGWRGETGHLSREMVERHLPDGIEDRGFYLCGPARLLREAEDILRGMGVPEDRLHSEVFRLLD